MNLDHRLLMIMPNNLHLKDGGLNNLRAGGELRSDKVKNHLETVRTAFFMMTTSLFADGDFRNRVILLAMQHVSIL